MKVEDVEKHNQAIKDETINNIEWVRKCQQEDKKWLDKFTELAGYGTCSSDYDPAIGALEYFEKYMNDCDAYEKRVISDIVRIFNPNKELKTYQEVVEFLEKVSKADLVYIQKLDNIHNLTKDIYSEVER